VCSSIRYKDDEVKVGVVGSRLVSESSTKLKNLRARCGQKVVVILREMCWRVNRKEDSVWMYRFSSKVFSVAERKESYSTVAIS